MFIEPRITSKSHSCVVIAISKSITVCKKLGSSFYVYITLHLSVWDFVCCLIRITQHTARTLCNSLLSNYVFITIDVLVT